jgi:hypothetical protein
MVTLAFAIINYELKFSAVIETVKGKTKEACYEKMKNFILEYFDDVISEFTEDHQKEPYEFKVKNEAGYNEFYEYLHEWILDDEYYIIKNFI